MVFKKHFLSGNTQGKEFTELAELAELTELAELAEFAELAELAEFTELTGLECFQPTSFNFHQNKVHYVSLDVGATGFDRGLYRSLDARRACLLAR